MTYSSDVTGEASPLAGPILLAKGAFIVQSAPRGTVGTACQPGTLQDLPLWSGETGGQGLQSLSLQKSHTVRPATARTKNTHEQQCKLHIPLLLQWVMCFTYTLQYHILKFDCKFLE